MSFLALDVQKNYMLLQQSALQYNEICVQNQKSYAETQMAAVQQKYSGSNNDFTNDSNYQKYYLLDQQFTTQIASFETQLKSLTANIESFQKIVDNNIKSECKISLLG